MARFAAHLLRCERCGPGAQGTLDGREGGARDPCAQRQDGLRGRLGLGRRDLAHRCPSGVLHGGVLHGGANRGFGFLQRGPFGDLTDQPPLERRWSELTDGPNRNLEKRSKLVFFLALWVFRASGNSFQGQGGGYRLFRLDRLGDSIDQGMRTANLSGHGAVRQRSQSRRRQTTNNSFVIPLVIG